MSVAALVKQWQEGLVGEAEFVSRLNKLDLALFAHGKLLYWEGHLGGWNVVDSKRIVPDIVDAYMPAPGCLSLGVRFVENNHLPKGVDAVLTSGQNAVALVGAVYMSNCPVDEEEAKRRIFHRTDENEK